ncbi:thiol:disulfide interchange protein DsbA [Candidatus Pantoea edessiphila]|uniref:Thiol:disulfide interchange protein n=1 Tax=Candidatus Pantoea edessiphila TaxID=2044610 RepID=A0A2P5SXK6_9GAMM|nr:DsbA family protein [Candidatus Pantoea edessiphila]MBK4775942.1 thiol:disulfide interchange protein DsbA [Pantoea sp. Edef]PPI87054.1 thiol:disulfide interchange protein DsbA [Candidatus Pantoea edessiphila]
MKKFYTMFIGILISFNIFAAQFIDGKHYITLSQPILNQPPVVEFFSFLCQYCNQFENHMINYPLPKNIKITKYHVDYNGKESVITHVWAMAIALGAENKLMKSIFNSEKENQDITNTNVLKNIFIKSLSVSSKEYEALWNSYTVKMIIDKQQKAAKDFNVLNIPTIFVKGKYMINIKDLGIPLDNSSINSYFDIIKFLVNKK